MKYEYLSDIEFLKTVDLMRLKETYARIIILDMYESPIQKIEGIVTTGNINFDESSAIRRTGSLSIILPNGNADYENINQSLFSLNKRIRIELGYKNFTEKYTDYDILWFPQGVFLITDSSISHAATGVTVSITFKDKMCLLNGDVGGTLTSGVTLDTVDYFVGYETDSDGNIKAKYESKKITIYQIIQELVHHLGGEQTGKIIIDLDTRVRYPMRWTGTSSLYYYAKDKDTDEDKRYCFSLTKPAGYEKVVDSYEIRPGSRTYKEYTNGQDIGYIFTDFIYSKENGFSVTAGSSITAALDTLKNHLGNYEYFYDIDGNFIFRPIQNYLNTSFSSSLLENIDNKTLTFKQRYGRSIYQLDDGELITSYTNNPQYEYIKNDFVIWGKTSDSSLPIWYHLAIDEIPSYNNTYTVLKYKDKTDGETKAINLIYHENPNNIKDGNEGIYYVNKNNKVFTWDSAKGKMIEINTSQGEVVNVETKDWRTELYMQAIQSDSYATHSHDYAAELKANWPAIYNVFGENPGYFDTYKDNPSNLFYFLDIIDSNSDIGNISVSNIGRRTKVLNDNTVNCVHMSNIPELYICYNEEDIEECQEQGKKYIVVSDQSITKNISSGGTRNSAYDAAINLLYQYTEYNNSITVQCLPIYHLDVNTLIRVRDAASGIDGEYQIKSFSLPIGSNANSMSITATKALDKI